MISERFKSPPGDGTRGLWALKALRILPFATVTIAALLLAVSPASARQIYKNLGEVDGSATPAGSFSAPGRMAIDRQTEALYVLDQGHDAVVKFDLSAGGDPVPADFSALSSPALDGAGGADLTPEGALGLTGFADIAVDNSTGPAAGNIYVVTGVIGFGGGRIDVFDRSGAYLYQFNPDATAVAVGPDGKVYVTKLFGAMARYTAAAGSVSQDTGFPLQPGFGSFDVAVDGGGTIYVASSPDLFGSPGVRRFKSDGSPDGQVTADEATALAVHPASNELHVDRGVRAVRYGPGGTPRLEAYGEFADSAGLALAASGEVFASDRGTDRLYRFGLVTLPETITGPATTVSARSATLTGTVDPDGEPLTACEFRWGRAGVAGYSGPARPCSPSPGGTSGPVAVSAEITGLEEGITYHFRLHTTNANGVVDGANRSFVAGSCPNADRRAGASAALPDCRAYEMVSPPEKEANTLILTRAGGGSAFPAADGNQVYFYAVTPFADPVSGRPGQFVASRAPGGWQTRNVTPRDCVADPSGLFNGFDLAGASRDLSVPIYAEIPSQAGEYENCADGDHAGKDIYSRAEDGSLVWISQNGEPKMAAVDAAYVGASADAGHILFSTPEKLVLPLEGGRVAGKGLYDRTGGATVPVGLGDDDLPLNDCGAEIAGRGALATFGQISDDGQVVFFHSGRSATVPGCSVAADDAGQLYARIDAERTVLISGSRLSSPEVRQVPDFLAATRDGRRVFFTSTERLTDQATAGGGLYAADLTGVLAGEASAPQLEFLSPVVAGGPAGVTSLIGISKPGDTVYFTATGELDGGAIAGRQNVYRASHGSVDFVTTLTGSTPSLAFMSISPDGKKLALIDRPTGTNQVYLFDSVGGQDPVCVSCPEEGKAASGGAAFYGALVLGVARRRALGQTHWVTDDGRVYFNSPDQLSPSDVNQSYDVYEYDHGSRELISTGTGGQDSLLLGIGPDGKDVFFATNDSLVDADFDNGDQDIYTARVGGGFASPEGEAAPCVGDACQASTPLPDLKSAGSMALNGRGNDVARAAPQRCKRVERRVRRLERRANRMRRLARRRIRTARRSPSTEARVGGRRQGNVKRAEASVRRLSRRAARLSRRATAARRHCRARGVERNRGQRPNRGAARKRDEGHRRNRRAAR